MGSEFQARPHVVVVGAGVVGASIAWHLASHPSGPQVTIVAEDVGGTATPCSFAWLNASWHNPKFYYDFRRRSMAGWRRLENEVPDMKKVLQWCGSMSWDMPPEKLAQYQKEHSSWGYDIHRIERSEIQRLEPTLNSDGDFLPEWGLQVGEEGAVEAHDAARLMVADAQTRGARLVTAAATSLLRGDSEGEADNTATATGGVLLATGEEITADHVVLAAGVGCVPLCASAGVTVPLKSPPGLLVRSRPVGRHILRHVVYTPLGHMRQTADGRILGGSDFAGGEPGPDPAATAREQFDKIRAGFAPAVRELLALETFTVGYRPTPDDGIPILGATGVRGLSLAVMHSGVTNAAIVGELLAESVLTGKEDPCLKDFSLKRFSKTVDSIVP